MQALSQKSRKSLFTAPTIALWLALLSLGWSVQPAQAGHEHTSKHGHQHEQADLVDAAQQLQRDSERLYRRLKKESSHSGLTQQAYSLAEASESFYEEVRAGARPRALKRRYQQLADCLYAIKNDFQRRQYAYLSRKAEKRLDQTLATLHEVEHGVDRLTEQYSYRGRPDPYAEADRLPGTRPLWRR